MDARIGLDYIVENREYIEKLGTALDTTNITVKKQVFELLSALCAYSTDGYDRALETLEHYKNLKKHRYRFKIVILELDATNSSIEYQVALLAFINCIIISTQCLQNRVRIRNEFIGVNLLPVLSSLRRVSGSVADIAVQLDVFEEQRECDEAQSLQRSDGINLSSHLDVFYAILGQVADTPQEIPFLSILQHLLRIDPKEPISDIIWDTTETLVHRATLLENREDSTRLLRAPSVQKFTCSHCRSDNTSPSRKQSLAQTVSSVPLIAKSIPPPPPPPSLGPPPPPPPMMFGGPSSSNGSSSIPPAPAPPPAPSLLSAKNMNDQSMNRPKTPELDPAKLLPQQETPVPKTKMKTINWNKIPMNKVMGKTNIWTIVANSHLNSPMAEMDWNEMEGLFCQATSTQGSPKMGRDNTSSGGNGYDTLDRKSRKENSEIVLLDGKRSLNINIFLKQFRTSNDEIIQLIRNGEHDDIGAEKLRGLLKILPEVDELDMLKAFDGEKTRLGNAEKFLMQLVQVSNYKLRIESMLLKEEFAANFSYLEPSINAIVYAGDDLINNILLREVLYMVVVAGNFLNAGGYAGNAVGVKLSSLQKLTDIRANKPGMNLIHFVALQAEKRNKELLSFPEKLVTLENASKTTVEQVNNEINALDARIAKIKLQIELPSTEPDVKSQMGDFIQSAERDVAMLQRGMKEVEVVRLQLAEFFCEDPASFKLEECFKVFQSFCEKFKQAVAENERRRVQEEQATVRRKMREEQLAKRARQTSQATTPVSDSDNSLLHDPSAFDMRASPAMARRRMGSLNGNGDTNREDGFSPDITPTGSLRRRRSRVLSEEDDNSLMDFLRSSGHDNGSRERKPSSYGSLDRSWARRARSGSSTKKRPDLLNIDFGADRERPHSPSTSSIAENSSQPSASGDDVRPRISREWRQKIESWLQSNEQDDKQSGEDYRRRARRLAGNRRSFENDSENERSKLDPLPEEKPTTSISSSTPDSYKRVYPDWKPSAAIEKTDVVGTIEAIEDAQLIRSKDKNESASRSSRYGPAASAPLQSILEEDRRKSIIQQLGERPSSDRLHIYIRRPSDAPTETTPSSHKTHDGSGNVAITSDQHSIYIRSPPAAEPKSPKIPVQKSIIDLGSPAANTSKWFSQSDAVNDSTNNKIEIDSDNIETPPTTRRNIITENKTIANPVRKLATPRPLHRRTQEDTAMEEESSSDTKKVEKPREKTSETEVLGDGQFDRYSVARRTRRYRRPTDYSSGNEERTETSPELSSPTESPLPKSMSLNNNLCLDKMQSSERVDASDRWQPKLASGLDDDELMLSNKTSSELLSRVGKVGRNLSSINQEDVQKAIRNLKSPTETPDRIWSPPREIVVKENAAPIKTSNHELNDEGFEETQSLVSDTPSHGKDSTSSYTDQPECKTPKRTKNLRTNSSDRGMTSSTAEKKTAIPKTLLERNRQSLERSRSLRTSSTSAPSSNRNTVIPKRTSSLRKSTEQSAPSRQRDVERSGSRTSLRSSRSSLNSATSINTVRNVPLKTPRTTTISLDKTLYKKPLILQNTVPIPKPTSTRSASATTTSSRTPASRSSSSGSSIGPTIRRSQTKSATPTSGMSSTLNTSFKENHVSATRPTFRSAVSNSSHTNSSPINNSASRNGTSSAKLSQITKGIVSKTSRVSNFMRPTAASATKTLSGPKGK